MSIWDARSTGWFMALVDAPKMAKQAAIGSKLTGNGATGDPSPRKGWDGSTARVPTESVVWIAGSTRAGLRMARHWPTKGPCLASAKNSGHRFKAVSPRRGTSPSAKGSGPHSFEVRPPTASEPRAGIESVVPLVVAKEATRDFGAFVRSERGADTPLRGFPARTDRVRVGGISSQTSIA